ncbi:sensor histidine kinase [Streptomyces sp. NPDC050164]|uniref:sensor histidine kinase n=1 Tax=Streptomyces sp. NPDC050164 TaxID=3365605 RepID=UPI0037923B1C
MAVDCRSARSLTPPSSPFSPSPDGLGSVPDVVPHGRRSHRSVIGDHDALRRAVGNLLSNAVRLAPPGSRITVAAGRDGSWLWTAVRDEGPGIGDDDRARVFDRFWRAKGNGGGRDRPAGLGLAIV